MEKRKSKRLRKLCVGNPLDLLSPAGFAFLGLFWQFLCNKCMLWLTSIQHSNMFFIQCLAFHILRSKVVTENNYSVQRPAGCNVRIGLLHIHYDITRVHFPTLFPSWWRWYCTFGSAQQPTSCKDGTDKFPQRSLEAGQGKGDLWYIYIYI